MTEGKKTLTKEDRKALRKKKLRTFIDKVPVAVFEAIEGQFRMYGPDSEVGGFIDYGKLMEVVAFCGIEGALRFLFGYIHILIKDPVSDDLNFDSTKMCIEAVIKLLQDTLHGIDCCDIKTKDFTALRKFINKHSVSKGDETA